MAFRNSNIKKSFWKLLGKLVQSCAALHCCRNGANSPVLLCQLAHGLTKDGRKIGTGRMKQLPRLHAEPAHTVESVRIVLRR